LPLVAIGGVNLINAAVVLGAGADALAMISELVAGPAGIDENMRKMLALASSGLSESSTG
jgi:thiamine monophosphate synthase